MLSQYFDIFMRPRHTYFHPARKDSRPSTTRVRVLRRRPSPVPILQYRANGRRVGDIRDIAGVVADASSGTAGGRVLARTFDP